MYNRPGRPGCERGSRSRIGPFRELSASLPQMSPPNRLSNGLCQSLTTNEKFVSGRNVVCPLRERDPAAMTAIARIARLCTERGWNQATSRRCLGCSRGWFPMVIKTGMIKTCLAPRYTLASALCAPPSTSARIVRSSLGAREIR